MRHLYLVFVFAFAMMAAGFVPSLFGAAGPIDAVRAVHGATATLWMAMLVVQTWLIGRRRLLWHRRIGRASYVVVPVLIGSALLVVIDMLGPRSHFPRDLRLTLAWLDLWSLVAFASLYALALRNRRVWPLHARYMAATVFIALPPALGRLYGMNIPAIGGLSGALPWSYATVDAVLAAVLARDLLYARHAALPYAVTLALTLPVQLVMFAVPYWPPFAALADALAALG